MKKKTRIFFGKLTVGICAAGIYTTAFISAGFFSMGLPFDVPSGIALLLCSLMVLHLFVESGFELHEIMYGDEEPDEQPVITAQGFNEDFYDSYFGEGAG